MLKYFDDEYGDIIHSENNFVLMLITDKSPRILKNAVPYFTISTNNLVDENGIVRGEDDIIGCRLSIYRPLYININGYEAQPLNSDQLYHLSNIIQQNQDIIYQIIKDNLDIIDIKIPDYTGLI